MDTTSPRSTERRRSSVIMRVRMPRRRYVGRTLTAAGFGVVPYHDNVPSFGEWGWWIAVKGQPASTTRVTLGSLGKLEILTRYLTAELIAASLVFGKTQLDSVHQDFTSLTQPRVYHYHLQGWNIEEIP